MTTGNPVQDFSTLTDAQREGLRDIEVRNADSERQQAATAAAAGTPSENISASSSQDDVEQSLLRGADPQALLAQGISSDRLDRAIQQVNASVVGTEEGTRQASPEEYRRNIEFLSESAPMVPEIPTDNRQQVALSQLAQYRDSDGKYDLIQAVADGGNKQDLLDAGFTDVQIDAARSAGQSLTEQRQADLTRYRGQVQAAASANTAPETTKGSTPIPAATPSPGPSLPPGARLEGASFKAEGEAPVPAIFNDSGRAIGYQDASGKTVTFTVEPERPLSIGDRALGIGNATLVYALPELGGALGLLSKGVVVLPEGVTKAERAIDAITRTGPDQARTLIVAQDVGQDVLREVAAGIPKGTLVRAQTEASVAGQQELHRTLAVLNETKGARTNLHVEVPKTLTPAEVKVVGRAIAENAKDAKGAVTLSPSGAAGSERAASDLARALEKEGLRPKVEPPQTAQVVVVDGKLSEKEISIIADRVESVASKTGTTGVRVVASKGVEGAGQAAAKLADELRARKVVSTDEFGKKSTGRLGVAEDVGKKGVLLEPERASGGNRGGVATKAPPKSGLVVVDVRTGKLTTLGQVGARLVGGGAAAASAAQRAGPRQGESYQEFSRRRKDETVAQPEPGRRTFTVPQPEKRDASSPREVPSPLEVPQPKHTVQPGPSTLPLTQGKTSTVSQPGGKPGTSDEPSPAPKSNPKVAPEPNTESKPKTKTVEEPKTKQRETTRGRTAAALPGDYEKKTKQAAKEGRYPAAVQYEQGAFVVSADLRTGQRKYRPRTDAEAAPPNTPRDTLRVTSYSKDRPGYRIRFRQGRVNVALAPQGSGIGFEGVRGEPLPKRRLRGRM